MLSDMTEIISGLKADYPDLQSEVQKKLKSYKGVSKGTTDSYFEYDRGNPQKAYVFESAIDMMSFMQLHPEADNCKFVSMAGLKNFVVEELLEKEIKVVLCVDNDNAGEDFRKRFTGRCFSFTECRVYGVKDFNELLQKRYGQKDFFSAVGKMAEWSKNVIAKEVSREVRYGMHGNRAI